MVVHLHDAGSFPGGGGDAAAKPVGRGNGRHTRADAQEPGVCDLHADIPAVAGRHPAHGGLPGKYYIFLALIETQHYMLAVVAAAYVAVAIYYYFRVVKSMFVSEQGDDVAPATSFGMQVALGVTGLLTLGIGIFPEPFVQFVQGSLSVFR